MAETAALLSQYISPYLASETPLLSLTLASLFFLALRRLVQLDSPLSHRITVSSPMKMLAFSTHGPWSDGNNDIEWVPEERITLCTSDGLIQIGGNMVPRRIKTSHIVAAEKESKGGLQEKLTMTVAVPYLWGVPPAAERLHIAVRTGGGIVDKVYWQWHFL